MQENERWWVFTFGVGQKHRGHYVRRFGTYGSAREQMVRKYGREWAFQYSQEEWDAWVKKCKAEGLMSFVETELCE